MSAPVFFSKSQETITPQYNPLDQDILLKDALDAAQTKHEKDSIKTMPLLKKVWKASRYPTSSLMYKARIRCLGIRQISLCHSHITNKKNIDPTTEYENTNDYRGSFQYSYSPYIKPLKPFAWIKGKKPYGKVFPRVGD